MADQTKDQDKDTTSNSNPLRTTTYSKAFQASVKACSTLAYARTLGEKDGASAVGTMLRGGRNGKDRAALATIMLESLPFEESAPEGSN